jgi:hypothetical protein
MLLFTASITQMYLNIFCIHVSYAEEFCLFCHVFY